jgi:hypothetical protein
MFRDNSDARAISLVAAINLLISELHDRVIPAAELRSELSSLLNRIEVIDVAVDVVESANFAPFVRSRSASRSPLVIEMHAREGKQRGTATTAVLQAPWVLQSA